MVSTGSFPVISFSDSDKVIIKTKEEAIEELRKIISKKSISKIISWENEGKIFEVTYNKKQGKKQYCLGVYDINRNVLGVFRK